MCVNACYHNCETNICAVLKSWSNLTCLTFFSYKCHTFYIIEKWSWYISNKLLLIRGKQMLSWSIIFSIDLCTTFKPNIYQKHMLSLSPKYFPSHHLQHITCDVLYDTMKHSILGYKTIPSLIAHHQDDN